MTPEQVVQRGIRVISILISCSKTKQHQTLICFWNNSNATDETHTMPHGSAGLWKESETQTVKDGAALRFIFRHKYFMAPEPLVTESPSFTAFLLS